MIEYLAYDQVGSLRVVADGSGNPVKQIDYDSFGNVFYDSAPDFPVPFGFAGGLYDKDTKLVRFGYRDYDPDTGRWTAKDPIGFAGGDSDLYGYCVGDPVNWADAEGLSPNTGFIKQLGKMANKSIMKTIKNLGKRIAEHEKKLLDPAQKLAEQHHEHELRLFREQLELAQKEAAKRGLLAACSVGTIPQNFQEAITDDEVEDRTESWFDWLDPFLLPGNAY